MKLLRQPIKELGKLCPPAQVYLLISVLSFIAVLLQNTGDSKQYCVGSFHAPCENNVLFFIFKLFYIALWVFILQKLCSGGYTTASWVLVFLPIIAMFILMGVLIIYLTKLTVDMEAPERQM